VKKLLTHSLALLRYYYGIHVYATAEMTDAAPAGGMDQAGPVSAGWALSPGTVRLTSSSRLQTAAYSKPQDFQV